MNAVPLRVRPSRRSGWTLVVALLALAACGGGGGAKGQAGECAKDASGSDDITIVACTDGEAQYKIVGVEEGRSSGSGNSACLKYDEATKNLWFGKSGDLGRVLCLQELKK